MQKIKNPIVVTPYDPQWPQIFQEVAALVKSALGDNCVALHHVGSTSVPGLAAKPKIDMIGVVRHGQGSIAPLEGSGFKYKGEYNIPLRLFFNDHGEFPVNLHVYEEHHPEIELNLVFRHHLRTNPMALAEYATLKDTLLRDESSYEKPAGSMFSGYNLGKDGFIRRILRASGYVGHRFLRVVHTYEWQETHRIRKDLIDPLGVVYDPHHPSITAPGNHHFILCHGVDIRTIAHVEMLQDTLQGVSPGSPGSQAALRALATDGSFRGQGWGKEMVMLLEKWLKNQGVQVLRVHAAPPAEAFYRSLGFGDMPWEEDVSIDKNSVDLGKVL